MLLCKQTHYDYDHDYKLNLTSTRNRNSQFTVQTALNDKNIIWEGEGHFDNLVFTKWHVMWENMSRHVFSFGICYNFVVYFICDENNTLQHKIDDNVDL